ncbi:MAG: DUF177 domain-containing protein [Candidatus Marinimicrobia bacterium]|nr:DUF177 domain-containing protein [Candidatus Neomarinimicrobiota bacterium]
MNIKISNISTTKTEFKSLDSKENFDIDSLVSDVESTISIYELNGEYITNSIVSFSLELRCDVCLEKYIKKHNIKNNLLVIPENKYDEQNIENDEYILIGNNADEIDFNNFIRDTILLSIPFKKKCKPDCKGLCSICGKNKNYYECSHKIVNIDPRFEKLEELRKKLEKKEKMRRK